MTRGATGAQHSGIMVPMAHRPEGLRVHVTFGAPCATPAPVVLFSHGAGRIGADYAPLLDGWGACGLIVLAPAHDELADLPLWLARVRDLQSLALQFEFVERQVPALHGRLAAAPLLVAGHSFGGHTAAVLLGARPRIAGCELGMLSLEQAASGILLAPPGDGGPGQLTPEWLARAPYLALDWSGFNRDALIVVGTQDNSPMSLRDWRWHQDAYVLSPPMGKKLLIADGAGHYLGGIAISRGEESQATLASLTRLTAGYANGSLAAKLPTGFTLHKRADPF